MFYSRKKSLNKLPRVRMMVGKTSIISVLPPPPTVIVVVEVKDESQLRQLQFIEYAVVELGETLIVPPALQEAEELQTCPIPLSIVHESAF